VAGAYRWVSCSAVSAFCSEASALSTDAWADAMLAAIVSALVVLVPPELEDPDRELALDPEPELPLDPEPEDEPVVPLDPDEPDPELPLRVPDEPVGVVLVTVLVTVVGLVVVVGVVVLEPAVVVCVVDACGGL
jgi:hypothetical protein